MTTLLPGQLRVFDNALPRLRPDAERNFSIDVSLVVEGNAGAIAEVQPSTIPYELVDPGANALSATDVLAVYPPAGAEDATNVMLPHIALRARTLPWANYVGGGSTNLPWIALLLFVGDEATFVTNNGRRYAVVSNATLQALLPTPAERELLCHVRELPTDDPVAAKDDDAFVAIVIGNRLPIAEKTNRACLVDLRNVNASADPKQLPILYEWSFKAGDGGDFEAYFDRLRNPTPENGTGGVVAFGIATDGQSITNDDGELELAAPTHADAQRKVNYAGPLVPLPRALDDASVCSADEAHAVRDDGREVATYATAFELGRLLALSNATVLEGLVHYRDHQFRRKVDIVIDSITNDIPQHHPAFRGSWKDVFNDIWGGPWMPKTIDTLWSGGADPTGLRSLVGKIPGLDQVQVEQLAQIGGNFFELALTRVSMPQGQTWHSAPITMPSIAIGDLSGSNVADILDNRMPDLRASIATLGIDQEGLP
ncbi:MAG: hypothetical protein IPM54_26920 [Polyangiaceae bacterium]|nr:hypothetical protein [Polyangiaceae bacterium]